jgi:uncharacterized membrane protein
MIPKVGSSKKITLVFVAIFGLWAFLVIGAPAFLPSESISDLSGVTFFLDNEEVIQELSFPWDVVYTSGDRLCHQQASRSLFLNGNQMPFCSRCTAIWGGLVVGLVIILFFTIELDTRVMVFLILAVAPIGIDGVGQLFQLWESTNLIRVISGILTGIICGIGLGIIIDELYSIISRKKSKSN